MKCSYCGKEVAEGSKFCDGCGAKLEGSASKQEEIVYYQPKKSKAGLIAAIIIISVLVITGIIVTIILLNNGGKENNSNNNNNNSSLTEDNKKEESKKEEKNDKKENSTDSMSNIKKTDYVLDNGDIIVFVENKNNTAVSFTMDIEYYDEEGTKVDSNSDSTIGLPAKGKTVLRFYRTDRNYKEYELHLNKLNGTFFVPQYEDASITSKDDKDKEEIVVTLKNNSSKKIDSAKVAVVFYKNNKPVGYSYDSEYEIEGNKAVALYINYPYDNKYDTIEFDNYEAYLVEAYSYKY